MEPPIHISESPTALHRAVATRIIEVGNEAIRQHGRFTFVLSGGSTPEGVYRALASDEFRSRLAWNAVHFFWGDERCVIQTHPDSNYRMAFEALLAHIDIPEENIHRMQAEEDPLLAAQASEDDLREFFRLSEGEFPRFDLILLGLGEDGHTASIFPETDALQERSAIVMDNFVRKLKTHRMTMTLPVLNHAQRVWFLVAGPSKAEIARQVITGVGNHPAGLVQPLAGPVEWYLDTQAASRL